MASTVYTYEDMGSAEWNGSFPKDSTQLVMTNTVDPRRLPEIGEIWDYKTMYSYNKDTNEEVVLKEIYHLVHGIDHVYGGKVEWFERTGQSKVIGWKPMEIII